MILRGETRLPIYASVWDGGLGELSTVGLAASRASMVRRVAWFHEGDLRREPGAACAAKAGPGRHGPVGGREGR